MVQECSKIQYHGLLARVVSIYVVQPLIDAFGRGNFSYVHAKVSVVNYCIVVYALQVAVKTQASGGR